MCIQALTMSAAILIQPTRTLQLRAPHRLRPKRPPNIWRALCLDGIGKETVWHQSLFSSSVQFQDCRTADNEQGTMPRCSVHLGPEKPKSIHGNTNSNSFAHGSGRGAGPSWQEVYPGFQRILRPEDDEATLQGMPENTTEEGGLHSWAA